VAKRCDLARPVVGSAARFDSDQARRLLFKESKHLCAAQLSAYDRSAFGISAVDLENLFS
jgi:hypothetical protein